VRERDGTIRAEAVHATASALLEGLTLDDPGAPERVRLTAREKMRRAATRTEIVDANQRWNHAFGGGSARHGAGGGRLSRFADPLVTAFIPAPPVQYAASGDDGDGAETSSMAEGDAADDAVLGEARPTGQLPHDPMAQVLHSAELPHDPMAQVLHSADILAHLLSDTSPPALRRVMMRVCLKWQRVASELAQTRAAAWTAALASHHFECTLRPRAGIDSSLERQAAILVQHTPSGCMLHHEVGGADASIRSVRVCVVDGTAHVIWAIQPSDDTIEPFEQTRVVRIGSSGLEWSGLVGTRRGRSLSVSDELYLRERSA